MSEHTRFSPGTASLLPCPFCGAAPSITKRADEDLGSHDIVQWTGISCIECGVGFEWPPGVEPDAISQWNTRAGLSGAAQSPQQPVACLGDRAPCDHFVGTGNQCIECEVASSRFDKYLSDKAAVPPSPDQPQRTPLDLSAGGLNTLATDAFREAAQAAIQPATNAPPKINYFRPADAQPQSDPEDWREDPSADERWNLGLDFGLNLLCDYLGVDKNEVMWDAATETVDGDVSAVIGNILRTKFGEDWGPSAVPPSPLGGEASLQKMQTSPGEEIGQHIAWLYQFVKGMNADNWRDMRDNAERQIDRLSLMATGHSGSPTQSAAPDEPRDALGQTASEVYSSDFAPPTLREALEDLLKDIDESQALGMPVLLRRDTIDEGRAALALTSTHQSAPAQSADRTFFLFARRSVPMSLIRDNLMTRAGYSPYCGNDTCSHGMPRTHYIDKQFQCGCGWRSEFDIEFIRQYEAKWAPSVPRPASNSEAK